MDHRRRTEAEHIIHFEMGDQRTPATMVVDKIAPWQPQREFAEVRFDLYFPHADDAEK